MQHRRLIEQQRHALRRLIDLVAHRAADEESINADIAAARTAAEEEFRQTRESIRSRSEAETQAASQQREQSAEQAQLQYDQQREKTLREYDQALSNIAEKANSNETKAKKAWQEAKWVAETVYEAKAPQPGKAFQQRKDEIKASRDEAKSIREQTARTLKEFKLTRLAREEFESAPQETQETDETPSITLDDSLTEAKSQLQSLRRLVSANLFRGPWLIIVIILLTAGAVTAAAWRSEFVYEQSWLVAGTATLVGCIIISILLYLLARARARTRCQLIYQSLAEAEAAAETCIERAAAECRREEEALAETRKQELNAADAKYRPILREIARRKERRLTMIKKKFPDRLTKLDQQRTENLTQADHDAHTLTTKAAAERNQQTESAQHTHATALETAEAAHRKAWSQLRETWQTGISEITDTFRTVSETINPLFAQWTDQMWQRWQPHDEIAPAIRFGELHIEMAEMEGGLPDDDHLRPGELAAFDLPAFLEFPNRCSLLVETAAAGREHSIGIAQNAMLRLLTRLPPGKVRFTIIDPVGLGQSFAAFMHLADYEEALVGDRIWTETRHIEQKLADLTEHMENVIQKYLRNEFETISEYNLRAGEIAEPFRFLIIADFPANFSETAVRRLSSIINSGARCGVHTIIIRDTRQPLPEEMQDDDLRKGSVVLAHKDDHFTWDDDDFRDWPLSLDAPPDTAFLTQMLRKVGAAAIDTNRVEVPFETIAPAPDQLWAGDASPAVRVPLGRAGATKLQHLALGQGTSQHTLIAGKTGSGKSTLLHVLITNLALTYSPDEVEFYLVDFKKGVEFKTYATHKVPHARAVAIESDREFGLSVLQRVDEELKQRGNAFRDLGVQDLKAYRQLDNQPPLPRILLIIDEFQEFFVDDDSLAQEAALLLDRLVRQGRAFGIHVILGSQTLGGGYSLARSTIGQMQVRIALQCSESDALMIMDDDNAAARLLSRPGEAIYNDAGGKIEGNSPFQIVWLPEPKRERYLNAVNELADAQGKIPGKDSRPRQIVFEGNVPSNLADNHLLETLIRQDTWLDPPLASRAWLGDAVAIKDPTAITIRRQSGANLLIIGQQEEAAMAMLAASVLSLAGQYSPSDAAFVILDGTTPDSPLAGRLESIAARLPHRCDNFTWRDTETAMQGLAAELDRRQSASITDDPAVIIIIHSLQRFRDLRRGDDFSFTTSDDDTPKPEKQFVELIREGPSFGIHVLISCDTSNNLDRHLDRQTMREFDNRVLFQMSASDSSNLIDSPAASRLGVHRALFASEEQGVHEKFRPYALPEQPWLDTIEDQLKARPLTGSDFPILFTPPAVHHGDTDDTAQQSFNQS